MSSGNAFTMQCQMKLKPGCKIVSPIPSFRFLQRLEALTTRFACQDPGHTCKLLVMFVCCKQSRYSFGQVLQILQQSACSLGLSSTDCLLFFAAGMESVDQEQTSLQEEYARIQNETADLKKAAPFPSFVQNSLMCPILMSPMSL